MMCFSSQFQWLLAQRFKICVQVFKQNDMKRAFVVMVLLGLLTTNLLAQKPAVVISNEPGWHKIGEITASFNSQTEAISVLGADAFKAIKLRVTDAPIHISSMKVYFENGEMQDVSVASELNAGAETRIIDLKSSDLEIQKVVFTYNSLPSYKGDKAHVELYGLKGSSDAYRDDNSELKHDANETGKDIENATEETGHDINRAADRTGDEVNKDTKEAGDAVSEAAGNVGAEIKDKPYVDKVGPNGERIYMDRHSKYYYINEKGEKVAITKLEMKDNPKKD
jgi:hypothetical protein